MTDQPTKGPWELAPEGTYPAGEGYKVLGPWFETKAGHKTRCYVAQFMTKADAEFLVRAQYMDELVAAVEQYLSPPTETSFIAIVEQQQDRLIAFQTKASAILAKINVSKK